MNKKTETAFSKYKTAITSSKFEEMHLYVPRRSAARFRAIAKDAKMSTDALFEKIVSSFA